jgi:SulP family sulfate permease
VIGDAVGSRTQLYSLVAAAIVLLTMLFLGPALSTFPLAALGAGDVRRVPVDRYR